MALSFSLVSDEGRISGRRGVVSEKVGRDTVQADDLWLKKFAIWSLLFIALKGKEE